MNKHDFIRLEKEKAKPGLAVWLEGKSFVDTNPLKPFFDPNRQGDLCGPFLIERVLFSSELGPRVDLIDPATGRQRSMMASWLLVPKESQ